MKYGIAQWCFPNGIHAMKLAAQAGYDGIQIETGLDSTGYYMTDRSIREIYIEEAKQCGLEIISIVDNDMMYVGCQGDKDEEEYKKCCKAIEMTIETAKAMNCKSIMLPMFFRSQIYVDRPNTFERAVEVLQYACRIASQEGVLVEVETSIPAEDQLRLMKCVGMQNLTNFYDSQNLYWYDGLDAVKELQGLMPVNGSEMHICDGWGMMTPNSNGAQLLGTGDSHFEEQIKIICEYGWDGWLIVENGYYLPSLRGKGSCLELAKLDLETTRSMVQKYRKEIT